MSKEVMARPARVLSGLLLRSFLGQAAVGALVGLGAEGIDIIWGDGRTDLLLVASLTGALFGLISGLLATVTTALVVRFAGRYVRPHLGWFVHLMTVIITCWWLLTHSSVEAMAGMALTVSVVVISLPVSWWCLRDVREQALHED